MTPKDNPQEPKKPLAEVYHCDLYGVRKAKQAFLTENALDTIPWQKLEPTTPHYFFVPKDFALQEEYEKGFGVAELFHVFACGIVTARDSFLIHFDKNFLENLKNDFLNLSEESFRRKYDVKDSRDWQYLQAKKDIQDGTVEIRKLDYRPFDSRFVLYSKKSKGILSYPRFDVMKHMKSENIALLMTSKNRQSSLSYFFISKVISDRHLLDSAGDSMNVFPLYLYPTTTGQQGFDDIDEQRRPNLNMDIVQEIEQRVGLGFVPESDTVETQDFASLQQRTTFTPLNLLDYIYATLHSPTYRETYKEFLKIDFPRVPYPDSPDTFWHLVQLGSQIRQLHLLQHDTLNTPITTYPIDGTNTITRNIRTADWEITDPSQQLGRIWINDTQYFDNIPTTAWEFYIGGYQPAQKWLKDRHNRTLTFDDIMHYQKIIVALHETERIMGKIDEVWGGE